MIPELLGRGDIDVTEPSTPQSLILCIYNHLPQKEASLMRAERCPDIWDFYVTYFDWAFVGQKGVLYCVRHKNKSKN